MTDEDLKNIASYIIVSHTKDIEYLSLWEMTEKQLSSSDLTPDELEEIVNKIDNLISKAEVIVEFED